MPTYSVRILAGKLCTKFSKDSCRIFTNFRYAQIQQGFVRRDCVQRKNAALFLLQSIFCMNRELSENWKIVEYSFYIRHCASFWVEKRPNILDLGKTWVRKFSVPHINICYIFTSNWDNLKHPSCTACRFCKLISHAKLKTTAKHSNDL